MWLSLLNDEVSNEFEFFMSSVNEGKFDKLFIILVFYFLNRKNCYFWMELYLGLSF